MSGEQGRWLLLGLQGLKCLVLLAIGVYLVVTMFRERQGS